MVREAECNQQKGQENISSPYVLIERIEKGVDGTEYRLLRVQNAEGKTVWHCNQVAMSPNGVGMAHFEGLPEYISGVSTDEMPLIQEIVKISELDEW